MNIRRLSTTSMFPGLFKSFKETKSNAFQFITKLNKKTLESKTYFNLATKTFFQTLKNNPKTTRITLFCLSSLGMLSIYLKSIEASFRSELLENNLESELPQTELDITQVVNFDDYRAPNEGGITKYRHVFKMNEPGLLVSTGTERSFFGLIQAVLASPSHYCKGLVIRDINPKVKAYVDFNVLLLRLAENVSEYKTLSSNCFPSSEECKKIRELPETEQRSAFAKHFNDSITAKLQIIKSKLDVDTTMNQDSKKYYLNNLDILAKSYYETDPSWKDPKSSFGEFPRYHEDQSYFDLLQKYAKTGNIIATVGDIGDLEFLSTRPVSILDISNISDYVLIDPRSNQPNFKPKIISTRQDYIQTTYEAHEHKIMSKEKKEELTGLLTLLVKWKKERHPTYTAQLAMDIKNSFSYIFPSREIKLTYYSDELLTKLKESMSPKTRISPPWLLKFLSIKNWSELSQEQINEWNNELKKHPGNESFYI